MELNRLQCSVFKKKILKSQVCEALSSVRERRQSHYAQ